jgi:hypothetical protein
MNSYRRLRSFRTAVTAAILLIIINVTASEAATAEPTTGTGAVYYVWAGLALLILAIAFVAFSHATDMSNRAIKELRGRSYAAPPQTVPKSVPVYLRTDLSSDYDTEYSRTKHYMLSHTYTSSRVLGQAYEVYLFVVRHNRADRNPPSRELSEIKKAVFFLGPSWGNEEFPVEGTDNVFSVRVNAWGTFFAACRIEFKDGTEPVTIYAFSQTELRKSGPCGAV